MATYYKVCPHCGATLDTGEVCDCMDAPREATPSGRRAEYMDASAPALAVCKGCKSKRYCTSPCAAAEDEITARRHHNG